MSDRSTADTPDTPKTGIDRRVQPRVTVHLPMKGTIGPREIQVEARNLSTGGAFLRTIEKWPIGGEITLSFEDEDGCYEATAVVVHRIVQNFEPGVGVRFVNPDGDFRRAVSRLVRRAAGDGDNT